MRAHHLEGMGVPQPLGHAGGIDEVREHHDAKGRIDGGDMFVSRGAGIGNTAEEGFHGGQIDLDHVARQFAVRLAMHPRRRLLILGIDETETGAPRLVEPVGEEADAIAVLHLQVLAMRFGDIGRRHTAEFVSIDIYRHQILRLASRLA